MTVKENLPLYTLNNMFTASRILNNIPDVGFLETRKLEKILKLSKKAEKDKLEIALNALTKLGLLSIDELGSIKKEVKQEFIQARLRSSTKGYCFAIRSDGGEDIYIRDQHLNHAWHGDDVLVKILKEGVRRRSPEGTIQCILERNTQSLVCIIERSKEEEKCIGIPLEERISCNIELPIQDKKFISKELARNVVEVKVDKYPLGQYKAEGHVIQNLPLNEDNSADQKFLLAKVGLTSSKERPKVSPKKIIEKNRIDLTDQDVMIIDNGSDPNSPIYPGISLKPNKGGLKIYLHIPTVSERVGINSNYDEWLKNIGEAYCVGNYWKPLLNDNTIQACKFQPDVQNFAISLIIDIGTDGSVEDWQFCLSIIKPSLLLNNDILEALKSKKPKSRLIPAKLRPIKEYLSQIETFIYASQLINKREKELGSIELDLPIPELEILSQIKYDDPSSKVNQWNAPLDDQNPHSLITPIIRLANQILRCHLDSLGLPCFTIDSNPIDGYALNDVAKIALALDLELELDEAGVASANDLSEAFSNNPCRRVLDKLLENHLPKQFLDINPLNLNSNRDNQNREEVTYLSVNRSAPWCYPSNHYYDIANQHVLTTLLNEGKNKPSSRSKSKIELGKCKCWDSLEWELFTETSISQINAKVNRNVLNLLEKSRRKSILLRKLILSMAKARSAERLVGKTVEAKISGVQSYGFFAELPPHLSEGLVHVSSLNDDWYEYRSRQNRLVGRKSRKSYQLGDVVLVKVAKIDILRNQIDLDVVTDKKADDIPTTIHSDNTLSTMNS